MTTDCGCHSGTYEDGWHEQVSAACRLRELEIWAEAMERGARVINELIAERRLEREGAQQ